ncbi:MAG: rhodanese-like domain-containing protein [Gammaproteobacteria bacterium]|nr:rhodanese-like domain-containing protein [Gammaproteobacteria bacterium]
MRILTCDDIRQTLDEGAILLDVRNTDEFDRGALPNAKNIPLAVLPILAHERLDKENSVLVYCHAGARAMMAEKLLTSLGFSNVRSIGGIIHFQHCY